MSVKAKMIQVCQDGELKDIIAFKGDDYVLTQADKNEIIEKSNGIVGRNGYLLPWVHAATKYGVHSDYPNVENDKKRAGFLIFTDIHAHQEMLDNALDYLNTIDCLDAGICLGDMAKYFYEEDATWYTNRVLNSSKKPVYTVIGNHDIGYTKSGKKCGTQDLAFKKWLYPIKDKMGLPSLTKPYYIVKYDKYRIVLIVLNSYDYPNTKDSSGNYKVNRNVNAYQQEQINWFIETLNSVPSNYGVIIAQHQCPMEHTLEESTWSDPKLAKVNPLGVTLSAYKELIDDIVDAWMKKSNLNKTYSPELTTTDAAFNGDVNYLPKVTAKCDFSSRNDSIFICHLIGHSHHDTVAHSTKYPNQKILSFTCTNAARSPSGNSELPRVLGTRTEDAITVFSVDVPSSSDKTGYIYLVRIGSNKTINMVDRTSIAIPFYNCEQIAEREILEELTMAEMYNNIEEMYKNIVTIGKEINEYTKILVNPDSKEYEFITKEEVPFVQSGTTPATKITAGKYVEVNVSFPKEFKAGTVPNVVCSLHWGGTAATKIGYVSCTVAANTVTNKGFTARIGNVSTDFSPTLGLQWIATGEK